MAQRHVSMDDSFHLPNFPHMAWVDPSALPAIVIMPSLRARFEGIISSLITLYGLYVESACSNSGKNDSQKLFKINFLTTRSKTIRFIDAFLPIYVDSDYSSRQKTHTTSMRTRATHHPVCAYWPSESQGELSSHERAVVPSGCFFRVLSWRKFLSYAL